MVLLSRQHRVKLLLDRHGSRVTVHALTLLSITCVSTVLHSCTKISEEAQPHQKYRSRRRSMKRTDLRHAANVDKT